MNRKFLIIASFMLVCLSLMTGCSSDDEKDLNSLNSKPIEVKAEDGIILLDEGVGRWYIYCAKFGMKDVAVIFFPIQLENEFMEEGTHVRFSGKMLGPVSTKTLPAGTNCFLIDISDIEKIEDVAEP